MNARTALIAAIACGALAVGIVAVDVLWTLEVHLETHYDGQWHYVVSAPTDFARPGFGYPYACAGPDLRLVVDNDRPIGANLHVRITQHGNNTQGSVVLLDEQWALDRFTSRTHEFTIPASAFPSSPPDGSEKPRGPDTLSVNVHVGDHQLYATVCKEAMA